MTDTTYQELRVAIIDRVESVVDGLHYARRPLTPQSDPGPALDKAFSVEFIDSANTRKYRDYDRERVAATAELVMFHRVHPSVDEQGYLDTQDERDDDERTTVAALMRTITPPLNTCALRHTRTMRTVHPATEWLITRIYLDLEHDWSLVEA